MATCPMLVVDHHHVIFTEYFVVLSIGRLSLGLEIQHASVSMHDRVCQVWCAYLLQSRNLSKYTLNKKLLTKLHLSFTVYS